MAESHVDIDWNALRAAAEEARDHALLYSSSDLSGLMLPKFDDLDALSELDALDSAERDPDA